jgi:hypothetical protein
MNTPITGYGKKIWAFAAGHIPLETTGVEPEFTSHDKIAVLNTSAWDAEIQLQIFYDDSDPVKDHSISVKANRIRKIRINDLIDPLPVPLDKPYAFVLRSNVPVIVQFSRMNTAHKNLAAFCSNSFYDADHE